MSLQTVQDLFRCEASFEIALSKYNIKLFGQFRISNEEIERRAVYEDKKINLFTFIKTKIRSYPKSSIVHLSRLLKKVLQKMVLILTCTACCWGTCWQCSLGTWVHFLSGTWTGTEEKIRIILTIQSKSNRKNNLNEFECCIIKYVKFATLNE